MSFSKCPLDDTHTPLLLTLLTLCYIFPLDHILPVGCRDTVLLQVPNLTVRNVFIVQQ